MGLNSSNKVDTNLFEMEISVDAETFNAAVNRAYKKNVKKMSVPGFRKGKAPQSICEKLYGEGIFFDDAIDEVMSPAYAAAVQEAKLDVVSRPEVEIKTVSKNDGLVFVAKVYVKPDVELECYKEVEIDKNINTIGAAQVNQELENMRNRNARVITVTDAPAKDGDTVTLDFKGYQDDVAFEGGEGHDYPLTLGSGSFIPGFEDQIVGHNIGEEFDVNVTFPEDYGAEDLAGKPAKFVCKISAIKTRELPELDDEFAKDVSEFDTLDALKKDIKKRLQTEENNRAENAMEDALMEKVVESMKGEIPECMYEERIDELVNDFSYRLASQGMKVEDYMKYTGMDMAKLRDSFRDNAVKAVKMRLAMDKIVELENLTVSDEEIEEQYKKLADQYKMEIDQIKAIVPAESIRADLAAAKAIDFVKDNAKINEVKVPAKKAPAKKKTTAKKAAEKDAE